MRIDVITIFPEYLQPLDLSRHRQGTAGQRAHRGHATCGSSRTTGTAPSTTRPTAAVRAWS